MRFFQARILEWVAISFSRGSPQHRGRQILYWLSYKGSPGFLLKLDSSAQMSPGKVSGIWLKLGQTQDPRHLQALQFCSLHPWPWGRSRAPSRDSVRPWNQSLPRQVSAGWGWSPCGRERERSWLQVETSPTGDAWRGCHSCSLSPGCWLLESISLLTEVSTKEGQEKWQEIENSNSLVGLQLCFFKIKLIND